MIKTIIKYECEVIRRGYETQEWLHAFSLNPCHIVWTTDSDKALKFNKVELYDNLEKDVRWKKLLTGTLIVDFHIVRESVAMYDPDVQEYLIGKSV